MMIEVSIIIVSWKCKEFIKNCIQSIRRSTNLSYEIIVIDNNSQDGTIELLEKEFPECKLIKLDKNLGFSRANNIGIRQARAKSILLLNPDTIIKTGAIEGLLRSLESNASIGIVGPRVFNPDGTVQLSSPRRWPSLFSEFLEIAELKYFFPDNGLIDKYHYEDWDHATQRQVEVVSGCCMLIREEVIKTLEGLDEDIFFGVDDIDFCWRAKKAGWKVLFVPTSEIVHFLSQSYKKDSLRMRKIDLESMYIFFYKTRGKAYARGYSWLVCFLSLIWLIIESFRCLLTLESRKRTVLKCKIIPKYWQAIHWAFERKPKINLTKQRYSSEELHFNKIYKKVKRDKANLVIPESEIERYRYPLSSPKYGRVFCFYLLGDLSGKKVLDYGCGEGDNAVFLAKKGAQVCAIDISSEAIRLTKAKAQANGVLDKVQAVQMNVEETDFNDMEFDCILGNAILHHLYLSKAKREVYRLLKFGGIAIFREPLTSSQLFLAIRKLIPIYPSHPTKGERPLNYEQLRLFGEGFRSMDCWEFEIFSRISYLIQNKKINEFLHRLDYFMMQKIPVTKKLASCTVVRYIK